MITIKCRFCQKEFKSLILDKPAASLDVTNRATAHMVERHPKEATNYSLLIQLFIGKVPAILMYETLLIIDPENEYMKSEINQAKTQVMEIVDKWEKVASIAQDPPSPLSIIH